MAPTGLATLFPLWLRDSTGELITSTADLAEEMMAAGICAVITCIDPKKLDKSFVGRVWTGSSCKICLMVWTRVARMVSSQLSRRWSNV